MPLTLRPHNKNKNNTCTPMHPSVHTHTHTHSCVHQCPSSVWNEIIHSCTDLARSNAQDVRRQLEFAGVSFVEGFASFPDSGGTKSLFITQTDNSVTTLNAEKIMIATGSKPFRPGGIPFDGKRIFDSDSINQVRNRWTMVTVQRQSHVFCMARNEAI